MWFIKSVIINFENCDFFSEVFFSSEKHLVLWLVGKNVLFGLKPTVNTFTPGPWRLILQAVGGTMTESTAGIELLYCLNSSVPLCLQVAKKEKQNKTNEYKLPTKTENLTREPFKHYQPNVWLLKLFLLQSLVQVASENVSGQSRPTSSNCIWVASAFSVVEAWAAGR